MESSAGKGSFAPAIVLPCNLARFRHSLFEGPGKKTRWTKYQLQDWRSLTDICNSCWWAQKLLWMRSCSMKWNCNLLVSAEVWNASIVHGANCSAMREQEYVLCWKSLERRRLPDEVSRVSAMWQDIHSLLSHLEDEIVANFG